MRKLVACLIALAATAVTGNQASAANIAYINASGGSVNYLTGYGHTVTNFNDPIGLTLGSLAGYDAILIASNGIFTQATNIGNVAKQFADAGGGVVLAQFAFQGQWQVGGGITNAGYSPFINDPLSSGYFISSSLGTVYDPTSPLLNGVTPGSTTTDYQANVGLDASAILVADWASGRHAIAYNLLPNSAVVGLNLFPDGSYLTSADSQRLVSNAINFSVNASATTPEPVSLLVFGGLVASGGWLVRRRMKAAVA